MAKVVGCTDQLRMSAKGSVASLLRWILGTCPLDVSVKELFQYVVPNLDGALVDQLIGLSRYEVERFTQQSVIDGAVIHMFASGVPQITVAGTSAAGVTISGSNDS